MTHNELVAQIAKELPRGITREIVGKVIKEFISVTRWALTLTSDSKVMLHGFGVFYTVVPKKKPLFGGKTKPRTQPVIRFKESRHGKRRT